MKQDLIQKIQAIIANQSVPENELVLQLKAMLDETEWQGSQLKESKSIDSLVFDSLTELISETNQDNVIKTGFKDFDAQFGGFRLGELVVIGGRPAMGKTQLLVNLSLNISKQKPVLYFTFDLSAFLLTTRFISANSGISVGKILQNELSNEEKSTLTNLQKQFSKHNILINDSGNNSFASLRAHCQKEIKEHGVKVIVVDCLQMMSSNKYRNNREQEISHISRELKNIAKDFNVCVIASSQLSRAAESRGLQKFPQLSDLRESGAIEQNADKVIFIYRPEYYGLDMDEEGNSTVGITELLIAKNRNGIIGKATISNDKNMTKFSDFIGYKTDFTFSKNRYEEIGSSPF